MQASKWYVLAAALAAAAAAAGVWAAEQTRTDAFASTTIDIGMVVSDVEAATKFYRDAIGMTEVKGFDVPAQMGADSGLTDSRAFGVRVFVLADTAQATKLKLIQFADSKPIDNTFIHSSRGVRYLTIHTSDMTAAVERLKKAGVAILAKGPYLLPEGFPKGVYLTLVRDPDGNMVELVGPKK